MERPAVPGDLVDFRSLELQVWYWKVCSQPGAAAPLRKGLGARILTRPSGSYARRPSVLNAEANMQGFCHLGVVAARVVLDRAIPGFAGFFFIFLLPRQKAPC